MMCLKVFLCILLFVKVTSFLTSSIKTYRGVISLSSGENFSIRNMVQQDDTDRLSGVLESGKMSFPDDLTDEWELDCYSRPVTAEDGRKLWEVIITDGGSDFKYLKAIPSNLVNFTSLTAHAPT